MKGIKKGKIFYGWIVVIAGTLTIALSHGIVINCFGIYIKPIAEELGLSRQSVSLNLTIANLMLTSVSLVSGELFTRCNVRRLMRVSALILPLAYYGCSLCRAPWSFYVCSALVGYATATLSVLPFTLIVNNWFEAKKGLALGLCFMGSGVGGMVFNSLGGRLLLSMSWRVIARIFAVSMAAVIIPCVYLVVYIKPKELGLIPYGAGTEAASGTERSVGIPLKTMLRMPRFWVLMGFALTMGLSSAFVATTTVPQLTDKGFGVEYAANVSALCMGAMAVGKVLLGQLEDKIGMKKSTLIAMACLLLSMAGLCLAEYRQAHIVIVIGALLGIPVASVAYPGLAMESFGRASYLKVNGYMGAVNFIGVGMSAFVAGGFFDRSGSYAPAFLLGMGMTAAALIAMLFVTGNGELKSSPNPRP